MGSLLRADTTELLAAWSAGDAAAAEEIAERLYPELHRLASRRLGNARDRPLDTTELVHEAYLRLVDQRRTDWRGRGHFFAIAARVMRHVVANQERDRRRLKRGGAVRLQSLDALVTAGGDVADAASGETAELDLLALDEALTRLEQIDPQAARLVELRFYAGLELEEAATVLGVSRATVVRDWRSARAWLKERLTDARS